MRARILLVLAALVLCMSIAEVYAEPTVESVLDTLGFTNRTLVAVETFPSGKYQITLYAEYAGFRDSNKLQWYKVGTSDFNLIFDGPEGIPPGDPMGLVTPPSAKTFTISHAFGLSLLSPDGTWYTETSRNPDGKQHAKIYQDSANPKLFYIGFENRALGASDFDYNDMVISLEFIPLPPPVGGEWVHVGNTEFLAPWASLISSTIVLAASFVFVERKKRKQD